MSTSTDAATYTTPRPGDARDRALVLVTRGQRSQVATLIAVGIPGATGRRLTRDGRAKVRLRSKAVITTAKANVTVLARYCRHTGCNTLLPADWKPGDTRCCPAHVHLEIGDRR